MFNFSEKMAVTGYWPIKGRRQLDYILDSCGYYMIDIVPDGNCFFRTIARGAYDNESLYDHIRKRLIAYISKNHKKYTTFVPDLDKFLEESAEDSIWNNDLADIFPIAFTHMTGIPLIIYEWKQIAHGEYDFVTNKEMSTQSLVDKNVEYVRMCLFNSTHYNLIVPDDE